MSETALYKNKLVSKQKFHSTQTCVLRRTKTCVRIYKKRTKYANLDLKNNTEYLYIKHFIE